MGTPTAPFEPAGSPPPGVVPNYENPEDISGQVFEAGYACTIIALLLVIMRFYTRVWITKSTGLDDCKHSSTRVKQDTQLTENNQI